MTLRIVADENMPNVESWFSHIAHELIRLPGRSILPQHLTSADILLVRSVTQVNKKLLEHSAVKFVGSATIGTDHIDLAYLANSDIEFHHAPGCNAQSVVDWLISVFSRLHINEELRWWNKTIGVVGVGFVGGLVVKRLKSMGVQLIQCDPIRAMNGNMKNHTELTELLTVCDIVCLHAPHTIEGSQPTHHMIGTQELALMKPGAWLINAGRGPVIEPNAILAELRTQRINVILDVWPEEPNIPEELLSKVELASPHVAGYSVEGKFTGTQMIAEAALDWLKLDKPKSVQIPPGPKLDAQLFSKENIELWASEMVLAVYDPVRDTVVMRMSVEDGQINSAMFDRLRKEYPPRRELFSVAVDNAGAELSNRLSALGFNCN